MNSLSPEFRVLLACAQASIGPKQGTVRADIASDVQWPKFLDQANQHGLVPIAHRCFEMSADCPPEVRRWLHDEAVSAVIGNLQQISALKAVAASFKKSGVPWLCVKGPVVATTLYDEPALRPFSDIDVVIRLQDFEAACAVLIEREYRPYFEVSSAWRELLFRNESTLLVGRAGSGDIDLQWQLLPAKYSFSLAMDEVWARKECVSTFGICVNTLGPHDTLVFLCLHAAKHDWERLIWLVDIASLITRSHRLDWDALADDLVRTTRRTPLQVSLMLVEMLFGVDLPTGISNLVNAESTAVALCRERIRRWQQESQSISPWPWKSLYYRSMSLALDRRLYWHDVVLRPTPLEWKAMPLPFSCRGAYYGFRPLRLIWKHCISRKKPRLPPKPSYRGSGAQSRVDN